MSNSSYKAHNMRTLSGVLIFMGFVLIILSIGPILRDEAWYYLKQLRDQEYVVAGANASGSTDSVFARYLSSRPVLLEPVNTDFGLIIEKIGVNVPIVQDVSVTNEDAYNEALKNGVAHASVSKYPSEKPGNVYLFAHASVNFWTLGRYATVFNLLRKLETGDRIHVFYKGDTYIYETINKETYPGWNTYPLVRPVLEPILTLQTCDPPGTTLNRLVVTAKLVEVQEI